MRFLPVGVLEQGFYKGHFLQGSCNVVSRSVTERLEGFATGDLVTSVELWVSLYIHVRE